MHKILLVDDDKGIIDLISQYLLKEGFEVRTAGDGLSGLKAVESYKPNLIVLDIMLPGFDGLELLSKIRQRSEVYVIMLTAKIEETDKIVGLTLGADDYMVKPFSPRELVARIKAAFRRIDAPKDNSGAAVFSFRNIKIDTGSHKVWIMEEEVDLTIIEFNILKALAEYRGMVLTREQLLRNVWGYEYFDDLKVVDVHIGNLRRKLGKNHGIETVRGVGFRLEVEIS
ncbi:MAG: response regulator transcription factor [ANME-2 cluster archaeon]|nr:MAG: response regulator transcription factor [ANME-2 cluster archaeon]